MLPLKPLPSFELHLPGDPPGPPPPPGPTPLKLVRVYRCQKPGPDHFASLDPGCEGQQSEVSAPPPALHLCLRCITHPPTAPAAGGCYPEPLPRAATQSRYPEPLPRAATQSRRQSRPTLAGTYGCISAVDSIPDIQPFYRCTTSKGMHFSSVDPGCEGEHQEVTLYAAPFMPLP